MGVLIPLGGNDRACLAFTWRSTVHASVVEVFELFGNLKNAVGRPRAFRTVCGVDAFPVAHGVVGRPDDAVVATWPPPIHVRCVDCADRLGLGGRLRAGSRHWQNLVDPEEVTS